MLILPGVSLVANLCTKSNHIVCKSILHLLSGFSRLPCSVNSEMIKVLSKSGNLANLLKVTTSVGGSNIVPVAPAVPEVKPFKMPIQRVTVTGYTSACALPAKNMIVVSGPSVKFSVRFGHTDIKVPDFDYYRKNITKNPNVNNRESQDNQRFYSSIWAGVGLATTFMGAKTVIVTLINSWAPSAAVLAISKIEIKKSDIPEGKNITFKWRGKPLFVRHRTDEQINQELQVDVKSLRHPEHDSERAKDPKWLIVIGVCTHLGCIPIANSGDYGGYYCPCHGSHYDFSGRIRRGPAPLNLEIPPYEFVGDNIIVG